RGYGPAFALRDLAEPGQAAVPQPVHPAPDRMPRLPVEHGPSERSVARAADPDGRARLAHGSRRGVDVVEADEAALVGRDVLGPAGLDRLEIIIGHGAALLEGHADRLELLL